MAHDLGFPDDAPDGQEAAGHHDDLGAVKNGSDDQLPGDSQAPGQHLPGAPAAGDAAPRDGRATTAQERESELREALRVVVDPEIGIDVVTLGLIRVIAFDASGVDITMILTTPFCPYGGMMVQQVKSAAEDVHSGEVRITLGDEVWSPDMMEGGDWAEWGLV